jgi:hypothetical protein
MAANIIRAGVAAAIAEKSGHGFDGTDLERAAKDIHGRELPARAATFANTFFEHLACPAMEGNVALQ